MLSAAEFFTVIASASAAGVTSFFLLEQRETRQFAAGKAEELYTLIEAFDQGLVVFIDQSCAAAAEGGVYRPAAADFAELMRESAKARMLISFYFPALWPSVRRVDAAIAASVAALQRFCNSPCEASALELEAPLAELRLAMEMLKHAVVTTHRDGPARRLRRRLLGPGRALAVI